MNEKMGDGLDAPAKNELIDAFENVKEMVSKSEKRSRAGLMLGLQDLGILPQGFIGGYYPLASNIIVMNKTPLRRIRETKPLLFTPYSTHVLLHEYIHSLGVIDEGETCRKTYAISKQHYGDHDYITQMAVNIEKFFPYLTYPEYGWLPAPSSPIEIVKGFDKSSISNYIS